MAANVMKEPAVVNTNEFFCVPIGKSRQAAIFLGNLVRNAIEEGKRIPKRMLNGGGETWMTRQCRCTSGCRYMIGCA